MKKEKWYASYDTCDIAENQVKFLRESGEYADKTDEQLQEMTYADSDLYAMEWDYFLESLDERMKPGTGYWRVDGRNLGWQSRTGYKYVKAEDAKTLLQAILPNTDVTLRVKLKGRGFEIRCSHHDAPMGEWYTVKPCAASTYERES